MTHPLPISAELSNACLTADAVQYADAPTLAERQRADLIGGLYALAEILLVIERADVGLPLIPQECLDSLWLEEREYFRRPLDEMERIYDTLFEHIGSYLGDNDLIGLIDDQKERLTRSVPDGVNRRSMMGLVTLATGLKETPDDPLGYDPDAVSALLHEELWQNRYFQTMVNGHLGNHFHLVIDFAAWNQALSAGEDSLAPPLIHGSGSLR